VIKLEGSIVINRPVDHVFDFMVDLENAPQWQTGVLGSQKITEGTFGVGTRFKENVKMMGRPVEAVCEITEYEPKKKLAWKSNSSSLMSYEGQFTFDAAEGRTRSAIGAARPVEGSVLFEPLAAREARRETVAELNKLKSVLEGQA
jgi:uncharacterized membrane protein